MKRYFHCIFFLSLMVVPLMGIPYEQTERISSPCSIDIGLSTRADIHQTGVHLCGRCFKHQTRLGENTKAKGDIR